VISPLERRSERVIVGIGRGIEKDCEPMGEGTQQSIERKSEHAPEDTTMSTPNTCESIGESTRQRYKRNRANGVLSIESRSESTTLLTVKNIRRS